MCSWSTTSQVKMVFGKLNVGHLAVGDLVTLQPYTLRAAMQPGTIFSEYEFSEVAFVSAMVPVNPPKVLIVLNAPSILSVCDDLSIDVTASSGSGGRKWKEIRWSINAANGENVTQIQKLLDKAADISHVIIIPKHFLNFTSYTIGLQLQNFLQQTSLKTVTVEKSKEGNIPTVNIIGPSYVITTAGAVFYMTAQGTVSSCATSQFLSYSWRVFKNNLLDNKLVTTSKDPKKLVLPAYSLEAGQTYQMFVAVQTAPDEFGKVSSASTFSTVYVARSTVTAKIAGGYTRLIPVGSPLLLDASSSVDNDIDPKSKLPMNLGFPWECTIISSNKFGARCNDIFDGNVLEMSTIKVVNITSGYKYAVSVLVTSNDGRTNKVQATIEGCAPIAATITMNTYISRINVFDRLLLSASISAKSNQTVQWSVVGGGTPLVPIAITPTYKNLTVVQMTGKGAYFPLALKPNSLKPGMTYTFRISATPIKFYLDKIPYGEITITVNSPPVSGTLVGAPANGTALTTNFLFAAPGWVADSAALPLSYRFSYRLSETTPYLQLAAFSGKSFVASTLPAGLLGQNFNIQVRVDLQDSFFASADDSTVVRVVIDDTIDVATAALNVLQNSLAAAFASNDVEKVLRSINGVGSTISSINCTTAPDCKKLGRTNCQESPQTCGACQVGFVGLVGDSNTPCRRIASIYTFDHTGQMRLAAGKGPQQKGARNNGESCTVHSDCLYYNCEKEICSAPMKVCPTSIPGTICSDSGDCIFVDVSGNPVSNCTAMDLNCQAMCICHSGSFGRSCALDKTQFTNRGRSRLMMCEALLNATSMSDPSVQLLSTLAASLRQTYDPYEVTDTNSKIVCTDALQTLSHLIAKGNLVGAPPSLPQIVAETISLFATSVLEVIVAAKRNKPTQAPTSAPTSAIVQHVAVVGAVSSLQTGMTDNMIAGQDPVAVVTDNVMMSALRTSMEDLKGMPLEPPKSAAAEQYKKPSSGLGLPSTGLDHCGNAGDYASLSVMGWGSNPFADSAEVKTPLLSFSNMAKPTKSRRRRALAAAVKPEPYFITLQFAATQDASSGDGNATNRPKCTVHDGTGYKPCPGCNETSFTNTSVTFTCYAAEGLCGTGGRHKLRSRRLDFEEDAEDDEDEENYNRELRELQGSGSSSSSSSSSSSGDDYASGGDNMCSFGALFSALLAALASVLGQNPLAIDFQKAKTAITVCISIAAVIVFGLIGFSRIDDAEYNYLIYAKNKAKSHRMRGFVALSKSLSNTYMRNMSMGTYAAEDKIGFDAIHKHSTIPELHGGIGKLNEQEQGHILDETYSKPIDFAPLGEYFGGLDVVESDAGLIIKGTTVNVNDIVLDRPANYFPIKVEANNSEAVQAFFAEEERDRSEDVVSFKENAGELISCSLLSGSNDSFWYDFFKTLLVNHDWFSVLSGPSLYLSRYLRWLGLSADIMLTLFFDTLFFMVFFPSGVCEVMTTKTMCLSIPSQIDPATPQCLWIQGTKSCEIAPPPGSIIFTAMITLIIIALSYPPSLLMWGYLYYNMNCKPDFDSYGLTEFGLLFGRKGTPNYMNTEEDGQLGGVFKSDKDFNRGLNAQNADSNVLCESRYLDYVSVREEANMLLNRVQNFLNARNWAISGPDSHFYDAEADAVLGILDMRRDGSAQRLSLVRTVHYGNARNLLEAKIERARKQCADLVDAIEFQNEGDYDSMDIYTLQTFILEQFTLIERTALARKFFYYDHILPGVTDPVQWVIGNVYTFGIILFCLYWTLMWGVKAGEISMYNWVMIFVVVMIQDGFVCIPIRVFIQYGITLFTSRPQLTHLRHLLNNLAATRMQDGYVVDRREVRLNQHLSGSCRFIRTNAGENLASAQLLNMITDRDVSEMRRLRGININWFIALLLVIPAIFAFGGEWMSEMFTALFVNLVWTCWFIMNYMCTKISFGLVVFVYVIIGLVFLYYWGIFSPVLTKIVQIWAQISRVPDVGHGWRRSERKVKHTGSHFLRACLKFLRNVRLKFFAPGNIELYSKLIYKIRHNENPFFLFWKNMNRPLYLQGRVVSRAQHENMIHREYEFNFETEAQSVSFPKEVQEMQPHAFRQSWKHRKNLLDKIMESVLWKVEKVENQQSLYEFNVSKLKVVKRFGGPNGCASDAGASEDTLASSDYSSLGARPIMLDDSKSEISFTMSEGSLYSEEKSIDEDTVESNLVNGIPLLAPTALQTHNDQYNDTENA